MSRCRSYHSPRLGVTIIMQEISPRIILEKAKRHEREFGWMTLKLATTKPNLEQSSDRVLTLENVKVGMSMNWTEANLKHYKPNLELAASSRASQIPTSQ